VRQRQVVKPLVEHVVGDINDFGFVRALVRGTDIQQWCRPAFRLQQFADQIH
jgi:hypothetical protein